ncbi:MAG TPA: amidase, partial [Actinomycetota bacterium]|nr:amidase [Actinomycetota bacterium]
MLRELAEAVATRRVGARELVALALERIERLDPGIGAVVAVRGDQALEEAAALDERLAQGEPAGPLAGIPFLVKDIEDLRAAPTTHGSLLFRQAARARADGVIPARLRAAGAIPVGKANTPEFASEGFTANRLFGATRNPWAPEWSPGGSSGGSAAAMATGMVPVATATDTGGSIRIPAAFCGLAGIKPTKGLVPFDDDLYWGDLTTAGPLGATVDDLRLLLDVMADRTLEDASLPRRVIAVPRFVPAGPLPKGVEVAFATALGAIERDLGFPVEPLEPEALGVPANPEADWGRWTAP